MSVTDNGTGVGVNSYDITVEARAAGGGFGAALNGTGTTVLDVHIKTAASLVAGTVTSNGAQDATTKVYKIAGATTNTAKWCLTSYSVDQPAAEVVDLSTFCGTETVSGQPQPATYSVAGFSDGCEEGFREKYLHINGDWRDHVTYVLFAGDVPGGVVARLRDVVRHDTHPTPP